MIPLVADVKSIHSFVSVDSASPVTSVQPVAGSPAASRTWKSVMYTVDRVAWPPLVHWVLSDEGETFEFEQVCSYTAGFPGTPV